MPAEQEKMEQDTFGFIGLGLIGGSIARAIRRRFPEAVITAYDPEAISLKIAVQDGVVNIPADSPEAESFKTCRVIFLCAPVLHNAENLNGVRGALSKNTILTDVGSVKTDIHKTVESMGLAEYFVGGHPMAGSERIGYRNSKAQLLENAYYILTPEADCPPEKAEYMQTLVREIGAIPLVMTFGEHDYATAAISHLPHVIAAALVNLVRESDNKDGIMKMIAAGGFKDITRISSSSPEMWEHICMTNPENIRILLDRYLEDLGRFREHLVQGDAKEMHDYFDAARMYRESFSDASSGPIKKVFMLHIDIDDQPGVIAELAVILANRQISIKNIGISHNREQQSGILAIEFYNEKAEEQARYLLISKGYTVH